MNLENFSIAMHRLLPDRLAIKTNLTECLGLGRYHIFPQNNGSKKNSCSVVIFFILFCV